MLVDLETLINDERTNRLRALVGEGDQLGLITSLDGRQLITLMLSSRGSIRCFETPIEGSTYRSLTTTLPAAHWFERTTWDMFGLRPEGHLRLKRTHLHDEMYANLPAPLAVDARCETDRHVYDFLPVQGQGVYEIPVGPIHAGIIEPGHFRLSCYGEIILNLEIRLGYVHRGLEKRLTSVPWQKCPLVAEAVASDMPVANALASVTAIESLLGLDVAAPVNAMRTIALEIERVAMHLSDLAGLAGDIGFLAVSSSFSRLRGIALQMAEVISGSRFMRGYIRIGGTARGLDQQVRNTLKNLLHMLRQEFLQVVDFYLDDQTVIDRMEGAGKVSSLFAREFGFVGVTGRACGVPYDCRTVWPHANYPDRNLKVSVETEGDVLARARVRVSEVSASLDIIAPLLDQIEDFVVPHISVPEELMKQAIGLGIVESHRGELIHLVATDENGRIKRYCIKDPSVNNWTALAIAVRNNVVADFPLCNKSFSLSYSGHDL